MLHTSQVKHVSVLSQWNNLKEQNELPSSSRFASSQPLCAPLTGSLHYSAATPCCPGKMMSNFLLLCPVEEQIA